MTLRPLLVLAVVAAGCGSPSGPAGGDRETPTAAPAGKAVRFSQCMREHGVSEFPDPDATGELTIDGVLNGSALDPESAAWRQALGACKDLQPSGFTGRKATPQEQDQRLVFARCIREHGVADFPDPVPGDPLVNTNLIPSSDRPGGMDRLDAAMQACAGAMGDALEDR